MTNKMQLFGLFICTQSALHVSGDVFVQHQEHLTVFTASLIVHLCCCWPVFRTRWVHDTGLQQHGWTISETVNTVKCSWWWVKTSPETCRADWVQINKPKVESCWSSITNNIKDVRTHKHQNLKRVFKVSCSFSVDISSLVFGNSITSTISVAVMILYK